MILEKISVGQTWIAKGNKKARLKILQKGISYGYKYCHKVNLYIPNLIEKTEWMSDAIICSDYDLLTLKEKLDVLLDNP